MDDALTSMVLLVLVIANIVLAIVNLYFVRHLADESQLALERLNRRLRNLEGRGSAQRPGDAYDF